MGITRQQIEDFLYYEAELLDEWKLEEWAELFTEDGVYLIPPTGYPNAEPRKTLFLVSDDHHRIVQRAKRLLKKEAHVEYPHSTTRHTISNVRIKDIQGDTIFVRCNFIVYRTKREVLDVFVGHHEYKLIEREGKIKIQEKRVILDLDALRPQGKVSIIL
ncbi:aromatic-ring-hydroxylating dioxygenase subunit beta [Parageobacillus thermoglucosidasius]|uniref:aromatic-ring-hydroxylating dioxygenase subunit beta n=1 Tax=Parageobacillus thermoglucosidasius TaxID=1426 RepID=UPI000B5562A3|nr:aromatic-ring-hydroxylating dioxygenase subunit beta [Parageobacillus thermoglucosidasius]OUM86329.1 MAG: p-cumate dioxygenase [Parageobacillus thermoglucosidasius]